MIVILIDVWEEKAESSRILKTIKTHNCGKHILAKMHFNSWQYHFPLSPSISHNVDA